MFACDLMPPSYLAKSLILISILLTIIDHALPKGWLAMLNLVLAERAKATMSYLSTNSETKAVEIGILGLATGFALTMVSPAFAIEVGTVQHYLSTTLGDTVTSLFSTGIGIKILVPVIGALIGMVGYGLAWLVAFVCRLHPFGAIGLTGWVLDLRDVSCGFKALAGN
jgi:hypothetical protein